LGEEKVYGIIPVVRLGAFWGLTAESLYFTSERVIVARTKHSTGYGTIGGLLGGAVGGAVGATVDVLLDEKKADKYGMHACY